MATTQYVVLPLDLHHWKLVVRTYKKRETAEKYCPKGHYVLEVNPSNS